LSATDSTTASGSNSGSGLYTRQSSGLVRDISPMSNAILNISFVSVPLAVFVATQAPYAFPGASPFWVTVICVGVCVLPVMLYSLFMAVMPRSGGDYVFISRTIHPWVGFAANFNIIAWYVLVIAYFAYLLAPSALATAFVSIGVAAQAGNAAFAAATASSSCAIEPRGHSAMLSSVAGLTTGVVLAPATSLPLMSSL